MESKVNFRYSSGLVPFVLVFKFLYIIYWGAGMTTHCHSVHVQIREQLVGNSYFFFFDTASFMGTRVLPASHRDPLVSTSPVLGLQVCTMTSNLLQGCSESNSGLHDWSLKSNLLCALHGIRHSD